MALFKNIWMNGYITQRKIEYYIYYYLRLVVDK